MRALFATIAVAVVSMGAALGQEESATAFEPQWDRRPSGEDYARNFPMAHSSPGTVAFAVLCCTPREDRRLDCTAPVAAPANAGFEGASIAVSHSFRLTQASYDEYMAGPRGPIRRLISWRVEPMPHDIAERRQAVDAATAHVCEMAPATSP